jgi:hypothetical protein
MYNICIWVNYNDFTATSLEIMVSKGNHPQMALIQSSLGPQGRVMASFLR